MSSVFIPRRANAAARFTAVVVLPTPPFWLTIARTWPEALWLRVRQRLRRPVRAERVQRLLRVLDPALRLGPLRRTREKVIEVPFGTGDLAALDQQKGESIVSAG